MPANQELAALLARRRSKIPGNGENNEATSESDDPIPVVKEPAPIMDVENDDNSRKVALKSQNSHVNRKPFGGGPPKLPFGLSSGKSLASRRPPSSTRNGEISNSNLSIGSRLRPNSAASGVVDEDNIRNDVDNPPKSTISSIQRQNSWSRLASSNTLSRNSPRTIITEDKKDSLHGRPSWSQITDDLRNQATSDRPQSVKQIRSSSSPTDMQTVDVEEKYEVSSIASNRKSGRSWIRPTEDDSNNQGNDSASKSGSDVPSSVAEFQEEFSRDALKQWKNKGKWNKSVSNSSGQISNKEVGEDIEQSARKKFTPWQKPVTSAAKQEPDNEVASPQKKYTPWRRPQPPDTSTHSTSNDDSISRNKFSTWKRPQQEKKPPEEVNETEELNPRTKFGTWNKRNNVEANQNEETGHQKSGHASWKAPQSDSKPVEGDQNDKAVPPKNKFATWRRPQTENKPSGLLKGEEATSNQNVAAWKRPQTFSKSEENEVPTTRQNEPTTPKDKFAYWKNSKPDKERVEVTEDEEDAKNKFAYWKKPQSETESTHVEKDDDSFVKNKFAYWKQSQSVKESSNLPKDEHIPVKDKFAYWKKSQSGKESSTETEEDVIVHGNSVENTIQSQPLDGINVEGNGIEITETRNDEESCDDEITKNENNNQGKKPAWTKNNAVEPVAPQISFQKKRNSWKKSVHDESSETSEFESYSPKNKTKSWVDAQFKEDEVPDQNPVSNNKFAAWKKSQTLHSPEGSFFEFNSPKEPFPNKINRQMSGASDDLSIDDVNSAIWKEDQPFDDPSVGLDVERHPEEEQSETWDSPSPTIGVDEEFMDISQKSREKQFNSLSDNLFDQPSFAAARVNLVSSLKLSDEKNEQVDFAKTEKVEFATNRTNDTSATLSNELFEDSFSSQSNRNSTVVSSPDMFANHLQVSPKKPSSDDQVSRRITKSQSPSESSLEEQNHMSTFKSAFSNDENSLYVKKKTRGKNKIKTKKSLDFSPLVPKETSIDFDETRKSMTGGLDNKTSRGMATSNSSVGSKSGYEKRVGRFLARKSKMKQSQHTQDSIKKGATLMEKNDVGNDFIPKSGFENKKLQEWDTSSVDFSQLNQGSSSVCSVHSASSRRRRSEIRRRQKSRNKDQPMSNKTNEKEVAEVEEKIAEEYDFFKNAPAHIDNINNSFETSKYDEGDMDSITGEIRSSYEADAKSVNEAKTDTLEKTNETQHLHIDNINIGHTSLFSASIINKPVKETMERTTLGISSRPETPLDPFIDDNPEIPSAPTDLSNSVYSVLPFDEAKDNRTFRPVTSELPKPVASDTTYLTPKFTRKKNSFSEEQPVSIITPEDQCSFENIIGNNSSFSIVEKSSGGSAVVELQTENTKLREKIDSLQDNLSQKDVMIEHLTKIVEGFQNKASIHSGNDLVQKSTTTPILPTMKESVEIKLSESFNSNPGKPVNVDSPLRYPDKSIRKQENEDYSSAENVLSPSSKTSSYRHARERRERRRTKVKGFRDVSIEPSMHLTDKRVNAAPPLVHGVHSPKIDSIANEPTTKNAVMNVGRKAIRASNAQRRFLC